MLNYEIDALIEYDTNINDSVFDYLVTSFAKKDRDKLFIFKNYLVTQNISNTYFEIHDDNEKIFTTHSYKWSFKRTDLTTSCELGRNYILTKEKSKYFIFLSHPIFINKSSYHLTLIKDVTFIMDSRSSQYKYFMFIMIFVVVALIILSYFLSRYITKDLGTLTEVANHIENGNYKVRTHLEAKDEIGMLGYQIDKMAQVIECNIISLENETQAKQRFIDNLTHELRSPMTSIIGYSELMLRSKYNKDIFDRSLYHIFSEGNRLTHLSQKMTEYILLKNYKMDTSEIQIKEIIEEVNHISVGKYDHNNIHIKHEGDDFIMNTDKYLLETIILNLVDNAIKASLKKLDSKDITTKSKNSEFRVGGDINIIISTSQNENEYKINVIDSGIGMTQEALKKIYEPFFTVDASRNSTNCGIGLGMSICHDLVSLLNGNIHIESGVDYGTKVSLIFKFTTS